jgi:hypothetical protein
MILVRADIRKPIASGLAWLILCQGLTYGTIASQVVTYSIHLLIRVVKLGEGDKAQTGEVEMSRKRKQTNARTQGIETAEEDTEKALGLFPSPADTA